MFAFHFLCLGDERVRERDKEKLSVPSFIHKIKTLFLNYRAVEKKK